MKLYLKAALFTVVALGSVGGLIPAWLARGRETADGAAMVVALWLMAIGALI